MRLVNQFPRLTVRLLLESLLLDLVLAFTFFTSVCYAVLSKRFNHQRSAAGMSAAIGAAMSFGLIWWEDKNDLSIRNLGPVAVVFAMIVITIVIYKAIKQSTGSFSGGGLAIGLFILFIITAGFDLPVEPDVIVSIMILTLLTGLIAMALHHRPAGRNYPFLNSVRPQIADIKDDQTRMYRNRSISDKISKQLRNLRKDSDLIKDRPEHINDTVVQIKRLLPEEGWLTRRMSDLRTRAHHMKNGHIAKMQETRNITKDLPTQLKKQISTEIIDRYNKIVDFDKRIERLDAITTANEKKIKQLTIQAEKYALEYNFKGLTDIIEKAQKLQDHNSRIFKIIEKTENKLSNLAQKVIDETKQVNKK